MAKTFFVTAVISLALIATAQAAAPAPQNAPGGGDKAALAAKTAQCEAMAQKKPAADREAYMAKCMNYSDARLKQYARMGECNASAKTKGLKGAERKAFMKECLSNKG